MKPFTKRLALVTGLLFTALICMGIVYIDTVQNYWYVNGGFVKLIVSNQTTQAAITISTNTFSIGINTNETIRSFQAVGRRVPTNFTGNGTSAATFGLMQINGSDGGHSGQTNASVNGGAAGGVTLRGGAGGLAQFATNDVIGGNGAAVTLTGGAGGAGQTAGGLATNSIQGGNGGNISQTSGAGGAPAVAATNTVGGQGGNFIMAAASGGTPSAGWARLGGAGGSFAVSGGSGGSGTRTNGGNGGALSFTAGSAGSATSLGNPGEPGTIDFTAGDGSTGATNSNGGRVHLIGGAPGSGAVAGEVVIGRNSTGTSRGGLQIGPFISGGSATITNMLGGAASLDFGSVAAGSFEDQPITVTGVTSNNVAVCLSVPWMCATNGGAFVTYNSNDTIYVRFLNNQLVTAIDPPAGTFTVVGFRIR